MKAYLSRRYRFSASHRLHTDALSPEDNRAAFGKCNNPYGHGHNYVVEVTFSGRVDERTGMVVDLAELDRFASDQLLRHFDCVNLNSLELFAGLVPTAENLAIAAHGIFARFGLASLEKVRVEETGNNSFEYGVRAGMD